MRSPRQGTLGRRALALLMALGLALSISLAAVQPHPTAAATAAPEAAERARVIESNLSQLYEPRNPCTPGERVGEALLDHLSIKGTKAACDPNHLGLQGAPQALRVVVLREPGGGQRLAALVPGRASPFPLLTVTDQDAAFNGLPADALAEQWRGLLLQLTQAFSRLLAALVLLLGLAMGAVLLLDDRYAIGDVVEIGGRCGEVVDVGVLSTELRCADQRVVVVPNSHCEQVVNHTKLRSGAEVTLLLPRRIADLAGAMALIAEELAAFGSDPRWAPKLLEPPRLLGIEAMTADDLQVKALLITEAGQQGPARRELLGRLVQRLQGWPQQQGQP
ncbi:mechanosensitive ion channel [Cyanobium sp. Cruz CV13-4-11]|uniref:mechanosensitive ion channel family protein n=1 Tax=unclassified Cyanobium TaxID=2627006 RepID=UPI0020CD6424|nr:MULTISPECIES: mechanosensitive ion channel domain-containing protein [unclassified Cyanobium]MCP9899990.1 mechanosensitive ion channel [Cyanobium sp. Cruz CV11-17]MCP9919362.1 mechanosensitive ion channel [Cyanobium sp. Cruz CV13-4-11]